MDALTFPDCGAAVAREAREEIERSPLMCQLEMVRATAERLWVKAAARESAAGRFARPRYSAEELFAESLLEATDGLAQSVDAICERAADAERRMAS